jgi:putative transposase
LKIKILIIIENKMETIQRAFKIRIYPTQEQKQFIDNCLGANRFLYNQMLAERILVYEKLKDHKDQLYGYKYKTEKEYKEEYDFLKEADSHSLMWTTKNLITAYSNFYKSLKGLRKGSQVGFPKFKSKHKHQDSYKSSMGLDIDFDEHWIKMMKVPGKHILYKHHCSPKSWYRTAILKNITISKSASGKYFASCLFEGEKDFTGIKKEIVKVKGLDMSMQNFYVDEQGNSPEFKRNYREYEAKLAKYQQKYSTKVKGSRNAEKARIKVARIHEKIANKRRDFTHQLSHKLIMENDCVVVEHLNLKGMSQTMNLGKSTMDLGYASFVSQLLYKAEWNDKTVILADRWFASSKICSICGYKNKDLLLHEREWDCPSCGSHHKRDQNAAINLKNLSNSPQELREVPSESVAPAALVVRNITRL